MTIKFARLPTVSTAARDVAAELRKILRLPHNKNVLGGKHSELYAQFYINGRERGYAVSFSVGGPQDGRMVAFSENRNSDSIVVYYGTRGDFEFNTNMPNEKIYARKKMFAYNGQKQAAQFVFDYLLDNFSLAT